MDYSSTVTLPAPVPRGPAGHWIRQTWRLMRRPVPFLEQTQACGDPFVMRLGSQRPVWSTAHPEGVRAILTAPSDVLTSGGPGHLLEPFVGSRSVMMVQGEAHRRRRRWMLPPFHGARMRSYGDAIVRATDRATDAWTAGAPVLALATAEQITLEVIVRAVYGTEDADVLGHMAAVTSVLESMTPPLMVFPFLQKDLGPWSPWGRYVRRAAAADVLLQAAIDLRRSEPEVDRTDILALFLQARDEDGQGMDDGELRDQLVTLLAAGHITTATALSWALHHLHHAPDVLADLRDELDAAPAGADPDTLAAGPLLAAVCKESLRLIPVLPLVVRTARAPFTLRGHPVAVGEKVAANIFGAHRRPESWPDPEAFRPARFLDGKPAPYTFVPFGGGTRRCIGEAMALYEMKIVLATILRRFDLTSEEPGQPPVTRKNLALAPTTGVRLRVVRRRAG